MVALFGSHSESLSISLFVKRKNDVSWVFRLVRRTMMELERDFPYKKIFDVTIHLKGAALFLPECGVSQE
jgi:hypothetical protein